MNEGVLGWLQTVSALAASLGGLVVAVLALLQWKQATRWRQGEEGRRLVDDLFLGENHGGYDALLMTEPGSGEYLFDEDAKKGKQYVPVTHQEAIAVLEADLAGQPQGKNGDFIRECFDDLFYYLERIAFFVEEGFVRYEDVCSPLGYYAEQMTKDSEEAAVYRRYMAKIRAVRATRLLKRLEAGQAKGKGLTDAP